MLFSPALTLASISWSDTITLVWQSLGVFSYLFIALLLAIVAFLVQGWLLLGRNWCPFNFDHGLDAATLASLRQLANQGLTDAEINRQLFSGQTSPDRNLFFAYLASFSRRNREQPLPPSLVHATEALYQIGRISNASGTARFLSCVLPALGLLGTLIGMFNAFFGTDFSKGEQLSATMANLMQCFALALFTTIAAVLLKVAVDLFNHFTLEVYIARMRGQLARLRTVMFDLIHEAEYAKPAPEPAAPAPVTPEA